MEKANEIDDFLISLGYNVTVFDTPMDMLTHLKMEIPSLVILNRDLPNDSDGTEICRIIRDEKRLRSLPIILITPDENEQDEIYALEMGADSVLVGDYSNRLLLARIKTIFRRSAILNDLYDTQDYIQIKDVYIDSVKHEVYKNNELIKMTYKEFELLYTLARHKGQVLTRESLLNMVWGYTYAGETRTVDVHIRSIRRLIGDENKTYIETVRGVGYKFNED